MDKEVSLGETFVHILRYADDIALIDRGDVVGVLVASARLQELRLLQRAPSRMQT